MDIEIDPITGRIYSALVDICTNECDEWGATAETPTRSYGAIGRQIAGPYLLTEPIAELSAVLPVA